MKTSLAILLVGCVSLPFASTAAAQTATPPNGAAKPAPASSTTVEPIIVTAERVQTLENKTPIAVTVLSGGQLRSAGITDPSTLRDFVPNFAIDPGNNNRITIRGVTSFNTGPAGDPSAAFLLDGVYIARGEDTDINFYDIARIEVLRGPQGTLYGRNSTAGVVDVITNAPTDKYQGAINVTGGDYGTFLVDGMVNIPVGERLALRAAVGYDRQDNYLRPAPGDPITLGLARDDLSGRIEGLITLSNQASLLLKVDYRSWWPDSTQASVLQTNFFNLSDPTAPVYIPGSSEVQRTLTYDQSIRPAQNNDTWGVSGEFKWDLGPLALTYLGSHRETNLNEAFNFFFFGALGVYERDRHQQDSQELRFATTASGPFRAQFGAYYFREQGDNTEVSPIPGFFPFLNEILSPTKATSYAGFGQATYDLTPKLHVTAGVRYTHDDKSQVGGEALQFTPTFNPATDLLFESKAHVTFDKVTWRAGLDYDLNANSLLYASVATGYKSGGFNAGCLPGSMFNGLMCNQPVPADILFYKPETLTAYEAGAKLRLADNTLQLNAAGFYYDYTNLQLQSIVQLNGLPSGQITNAAGVHVGGVELAAVYIPSSRHRLEASVNYLDAYYTNYFPLGVGVAPSYAGKPLDNAPKFTATLGYTYTQPLSVGGSVAFGVYTRYSSDYVVSSFTVPVQFRQPSFTKTNLTLTYRPDDDRWYIQAFVKNLEDHIQITSAALDSVNISEPRTFGVRVGAKF